MKTAAQIRAISQKSVGLILEKRIAEIGKVTHEQCWKTRNISCGRGRARGPNLKNLAGAGGRGGQISKILRARAGAGAKFKKSCGRGRARGPKVKILAGAGGRGGQKCKILRARAVAGARKAPQAPATNFMDSQCENFCGRGRARGPKVKNHAGAGGCGGQK